jgi:hypothetical protein
MKDLVQIAKRDEVLDYHDLEPNYGPRHYRSDMEFRIGELLDYIKKEGKIRYVAELVASINDLESEIEEDVESFCRRCGIEDNYLLDPEYDEEGDAIEGSEWFDDGTAYADFSSIFNESLNAIKAADLSILCKDSDSDFVDLSAMSEEEMDLIIDAHYVKGSWEELKEEVFHILKRMASDKLPSDMYLYSVPYSLDLLVGKGLVEEEDIVSSFKAILDRNGYVGSVKDDISNVIDYMKDTKVCPKLYKVAPELVALYDERYDTPTKEDYINSRKIRSLPASTQYSFSDLYTPLHELRKVLKKAPDLTMKVSELSKKYPRIMDTLKTNEAFLKNLASHKTISVDDLDAFENRYLNNVKYDVHRSTWKGMQKAYANTVEHLVLIIDFPAGFLKDIPNEGTLHDDLRQFLKLGVDLSASRTHPHSAHMMGWVRLELDPHNEFVFVDEIQSDFQTFCHKIEAVLVKKESVAEGDFIPSWIEHFSKNGNSQIGRGRLLLCAQALATYLQRFSSVAMSVISLFARENGYKKIYYHTYEGGKLLKGNDPPRSLYTDVPKKHFFEVTNEKPFKLPADFYVREAKAKVGAVCKKLST